MAEYLSEHFTLEEMIYSETAKAKKLDNTPTLIHKKILKHTCEYLLEKVRSLLNNKYKEYRGKKVKEVVLKITSGYRSEAVNIAVGGANTSQHLKGEAADLEARIVFKDGTKCSLPYNELYENIKVWTKAGKISVDQCIQERAWNKKLNKWDYWVHVSHHNAGKTKDRRQFLRYNNGMYSLDCDLP